MFFGPDAVVEAYDWRAGLLTEDEILSRLFKLNQERATAEDKAIAKKVPKPKSKAKNPSVKERASK